MLDEVEWQGDGLAYLVGDKGWPADSLLSTGEKFVHEMPLTPGGSVPFPAFHERKVLRTTSRLVESWSNGQRNYETVGTVVAGETVTVFGPPNDWGDCRITFHEPELVKCADLEPFLHEGASGSAGQQPAAQVPMGQELTIESSGADLFNLFLFAVEDFCAGRSCFYAPEDKDHCSPDCTYDGVEGVYAGREILLADAKALLPRTSRSMIMISQQGVPQEFPGNAASLAHASPGDAQAYRFWLRSCPVPGCGSLLVLLKDETEGYLFDVPAGLPMSTTPDVAPAAAAPQTLPSATATTALDAFVAQIKGEVGKLESAGTPAEVFQSLVQIAEKFETAKDLVKAADFSHRVFAADVWSGLFTAEELALLRENADRARFKADVAVASMLGVWIADAFLEAKGEAWLRELSGGGRGANYLVSGAYELVDAVATGGSAALTGPTPVTVYLYGLSKLADVWVVHDRLMRDYDVVVAQAISGAQMRLLHMQTGPTYTYSDVLIDIQALQGSAKDMMTGTGLGAGFNVETGRKLTIVLALTRLRARQIEGLDLAPDARELESLVSEFDSTPGTFWERYTQAVWPPAQDDDAFALFARNVALALNVAPDPALSTGMPSLVPTQSPAVVVSGAPIGRAMPGIRTPEDFRHAQLYDEAGGDRLRIGYVSVLNSIADIDVTVSSTAILNLIEETDDPQFILHFVDMFLRDVIDSRVGINAVQGLSRIDSEKHGDLYILWLLNRARSFYQEPSMRYDLLVMSGFERLSEVQSEFHAIGLDPARVEKWVHSDGREYVYLRHVNGSMEPVADGRNDGTFNYCQTWYCHTALDILPWVKWGATPDDPSTPEERALLYKNAFDKLRPVRAGAGQLASFIGR